MPKTRRDLILDILANLSMRGTAGNAVAEFIRSEVESSDIDPADSCKLTMKAMRSIMASLRDELDGMDGKGKYA